MTKEKKVAKKAAKPRVSRFEYVSRLQGEARYRDGLVITKLINKYHKKHNDPINEEVEAELRGIDIGNANMRIIMQAESKAKLEEICKDMNALEAKILAYDPKTAAKRAIQWVKRFFIGAGK